MFNFWGPCSCVGNPRGWRVSLARATHALRNGIPLSWGFTEGIEYQPSGYARFHQGPQDLYLENGDLRWKTLLDFPDFGCQPNMKMAEKWGRFGLKTWRLWGWGADSPPLPHTVSVPSATPCWNIANVPLQGSTYLRQTIVFCIGWWGSNIYSILVLPWKEHWFP